MPNTILEPPTQPAIVSVEDIFTFDLQGFIKLSGVLSADECQNYLRIIKELENAPPEDTERRELNNHTGRPCQRTLSQDKGFKRLNGLLRLNPVFDEMIAHPRVYPYLETFMKKPQLVNTWSISKTQGEEGGGWHRGIDPIHYSYRKGKVFSSMVNVVTFLTDNGPEDGCMIALPGGHKSNIDLDWGKYKGASMPGSQRIVGKAGDVFMFSEAVLHTGIPKTTNGLRTNLYYNYCSSDFNVTTFSPEHNFHFCMPPSIRARFNEKQRQFTEWMEHIKTTE